MSIASDTFGLVFGLLLLDGEMCIEKEGEVIVDGVLSATPQCERVLVREAAPHGLEGGLGNLRLENIVSKVATAEDIIPHLIRHLLRTNVQRTLHMTIHVDCLAVVSAAVVAL